MGPTRRHARLVVAFAACWAVFAGTATAQTVSQDSGLAPPKAVPPPPKVTPSKWRVSFRGGTDLVNRPSTGISALPTPGLPINFAFGFSTRQVPSWYFGDGAALLNTVVGHLPNGQPLTPLDSVLTGASVAHRSGGAFGVTLSREVGSRYRLEVSIDGLQSAPTFTPSALAGIEASRASFVTAWTSILAGPNLSPVITSTSAVTNGGSLEWMATGAVDIIVRARPRSQWWVTVGGGVVADPGAGPTVNLVGHSVFAFEPLNGPFNQTDSVAIEATRPRQAIGLFGGGWSHDLTPRWGITADLRVGLSGNGVKTFVSATPTQVLLTDPSREVVLIFSSTPPSIVFNNANPAPFNSSLSGSGVSQFQTFSGGGLQIRTQLMGGVYLRF